jgi:hypothetical protein
MRPVISKKDKITGRNDLFLRFLSEDNCTPKEKVLLLGATFLLEAKYFQQKSQRKN